MLTARCLIVSDCKDRSSIASHPPYSEYSNSSESIRRFATTLNPKPQTSPIVGGRLRLQTWRKISEGNSAASTLPSTSRPSHPRRSPIRASRVIFNQPSTSRASLSRRSPFRVSRFIFLCPQVLAHLTLGGQPVECPTLFCGMCRPWEVNLWSASHYLWPEERASGVLKVPRFSGGGG